MGSVVLFCAMVKTKCSRSEATVARRRKQYGLQGSGQTTRGLPDTVKRQMVADQLSKDPKSRKGPKTVREAIAFDTGVKLTR